MPDACTEGAGALAQAGHAACKVSPAAAAAAMWRAAEPPTGLQLDDPWVLEGWQEGPSVPAAAVKASSAISPYPTATPLAAEARGLTTHASRARAAAAAAPSGSNSGPGGSRTAGRGKATSHPGPATKAAHHSSSGGGSREEPSRTTKRRGRGAAQGPRPRPRPAINPLDVGEESEGEGSAAAHYRPLVDAAGMALCPPAGSAAAGGGGVDGMEEANAASSRRASTASTGAAVEGSCQQQQLPLSDKEGEVACGSRRDSSGQEEELLNIPLAEDSSTSLFAGSTCGSPHGSSSGTALRRSHARLSLGARGGSSGSAGGRSPNQPLSPNQQLIAAAARAQAALSKGLYAGGGAKDGALLPGAFQQPLAAAAAVMPAFIPTAALRPPSGSSNGKLAGHHGVMLGLSHGQAPQGQHPAAAAEGEGQRPAAGTAETGAESKGGHASTSGSRSSRSRRSSVSGPGCGHTLGHTSAGVTDDDAAGAQQQQQQLSTAMASSGCSGPDASGSTCVGVGTAGPASLVTDRVCQGVAAISADNACDLQPGLSGGLGGAGAGASNPSRSSSSGMQEGFLPPLRGSSTSSSRNSSRGAAFGSGADQDTTPAATAAAAVPRPSTGGCSSSSSQGSDSVATQGALSSSSGVRPPTTTSSNPGLATLVPGLQLGGLRGHVSAGGGYMYRTNPHASRATDNRTLYVSGSAAGQPTPRSACSSAAPSPRHTKQPPRSASIGGHNATGIGSAVTGGGQQQGRPYNRRYSVPGAGAAGVGAAGAGELLMLGPLPVDELQETSSSGSRPEVGCDPNSSSGAGSSQQLHSQVIASPGALAAAAALQAATPLGGLAPSLDGNDGGSSAKGATGSMASTSNKDSSSSSILAPGGNLSQPAVGQPRSKLVARAGRLLQQQAAQQGRHCAGGLAASSEADDMGGDNGIHKWREAAAAAGAAGAGGVGAPARRHSLFGALSTPAAAGGSGGGLLTTSSSTVSSLASPGLKVNRRHMLDVLLQQRDAGKDHLWVPPVVSSQIGSKLDAVRVYTRSGTLPGVGLSEATALAAAITQPATDPVTAGQLLSCRPDAGLSPVLGLGAGRPGQALLRGPRPLQRPSPLLAPAPAIDQLLQRSGSSLGLAHAPRTSPVCSFAPILPGAGAAGGAGVSAGASGLVSSQTGPDAQQYDAPKVAGPRGSTGVKPGSRPGSRPSSGSKGASAAARAQALQLMKDLVRSGPANL